MYVPIPLLTTSSDQMKANCCLLSDATGKEEQENVPDHYKFKTSVTKLSVKIVLVTSDILIQSTECSFLFKISSVNITFGAVLKIPVTVQSTFLVL